LAPTRKKALGCGDPENRLIPHDYFTFQKILLRICLSLLLSSFMLAGFGCATTALQKLEIAENEVGTKWLAHLEHGKTTKEAILLEYGLPSAQFEGERILTYRLMLHAQEGLVVVGRELSSFDPRLIQWAKAEYSLVLVFDGQNILRRHSLLRVR
jgi:hypothetical protein